jgi:hypothetical protein
MYPYTLKTDIMIDVEKYKRILDEGLLLDHYMLLCNIKDGKELLKSKRIQGFINLMCKKGYIEDGILTDKAMILVGSELVEEKKPLRFEAPKQLEEEEVQDSKKVNFAYWTIALHRKCEDRILKATGKRQMRPKVEGVAYSYLPNPTDLGRVIMRAIGAYKLKDLEKIEKAILAYVDRCIKADRWTPLLGYYIMKKDMSTMVTDMDNLEEEDSDKDSTVNI